MSPQPAPSALPPHGPWGRSRASAQARAGGAGPGGVGAAPQDPRRALPPARRRPRSGGPGATASPPPPGPAWRGGPAPPGPRAPAAPPPRRHSPRAPDAGPARPALHKVTARELRGGGAWAPEVPPSAPPRPRPRGGTSGHAGWSAAPGGGVSGARGSAPAAALSPDPRGAREHRDRAPPPAVPRGPCRLCTALETPAPADPGGSPRLSGDPAPEATTHPWGPTLPEPAAQSAPLPELTPPGPGARWMPGPQATQAGHPPRTGLWRCPTPARALRPGRGRGRGVPCRWWPMATIAVDGCPGREHWGRGAGAEWRRKVTQGPAAGQMQEGPRAERGPWSAPRGGPAWAGGSQRWVARALGFGVGGGLRLSIHPQPLQTCLIPGRQLRAVGGCALAPTEGGPLPTRVLLSSVVAPAWDSVRGRLPPEPQLRL